MIEKDKRIAAAAKKRQERRDAVRKDEENEKKKQREDLYANAQLIDEDKIADAMSMTHKEWQFYRKENEINAEIKILQDK